MIGLEHPAPLAEAFLGLTDGGEVLRARVNRMLAEIANCADDPAAATQASTTAYRIDVHADAARCIEQRCAVRENAAAPRRQKNDFCL
jgi:hypothetical protein